MSSREERPNLHRLAHDRLSDAHQRKLRALLPTMPRVKLGKVLGADPHMLEAWATGGFMQERTRVRLEAAIDAAFGASAPSVATTSTTPAPAATEVA